MDRQDDLEALAATLRTRLHRTATLGHELAGSIRDWMATEPFRLNATIADDRLSWLARVECVNPPLRDQWSALFSDAVHQLRSVLDNLAWGLATLGGSRPKKPNAIQFPIVEKRKDWTNESRRIAELPVGVRKAIESIQPFQRSGIDGSPESDGPLLLSRLNNTDKHRVLIQPLVNPTELAHSFAVEFRTDEEASKNVPPDVTLSLDASVSDTTSILQRTTTPIVRVSGRFDFKGQVVVVDPVVGTLGMNVVLSQLLTYVPQVLDVVLLNVAHDG